MLNTKSILILLSLAVAVLSASAVSEKELNCDLFLVEQLNKSDLESNEIVAAENYNQNVIDCFPQLIRLIKFLASDEKLNDDSNSFHRDTRRVKNFWKRSRMTNKKFW
jgi:hypothetical protein